MSRHNGGGSKALAFGLSERGELARLDDGSHLSVSHTFFLFLEQTFNLFALFANGLILFANTTRFCHL
jgi:hypothetical protein